MGLKEGDLSKVFFGFMGLLCVVAAILCVIRYRKLGHHQRILVSRNEALEKSDKIAQNDAELRALVAKSRVYQVSDEEAVDPVQFITRSSEEEMEIRLDRIQPKAVRRRGEKLEEIAIEIHKNEVEITPMCELLFYLEEAFPGGLKSKEILFQRRGDDDIWSATVTVSHFKVKEG